ncbi:hypothetical protein [Sporosarcina sp. P17b]|uniref:hypothetical protein n=1 Tax=Sporosarcina sp. P17b TaxID=2048260 RepID=UPI000C16A682|nr:hypothetical protein [Sporosarcina sp. P17b]PIC73338.1 hypothetical protein CSV76_11005 [Sporosarcina sp. P17b]
MHVKIKKDKNNIPKALRNMKQLNRNTAVVGYHKKNHTEMVAGVQEFGATITVTDKMRAYLAAQGLPLKASTKTITIPERAFIRTGFDRGVDDVYQLASKYVDDVIAGNIPAKQFLKMLGDEMRDQIRDYADDLRSPANHPFTQEEKGKNDPLEDSGHMIDSMEVKVK